MALKRRCSICGSSKWRKEPSSGVITCSEGHILQNYRDETTEAYVGPHVVRKRTLKSGRKRGEETSNADRKLYHGDRARFNYFQCQQVILRQQVAALTRLWNLPSEFEVVCRDIWALHLSLLSDPPPPEPFHFREKANQVDVGSPPSSSAHIPVPKQPGDSDGDSFGSTSSSSSEEAEEENPEIVELLRRNSDLDTSSEEDELTTHTRKFVVSDGRHKGQSRRTHPASTIAVLVVACWILRVPVTYMDFVHLIESYDLPYLEGYRLLPSNMREHLTKHTISSLSPHHPPRTLVLHRRAGRLVLGLGHHGGITIPEANGSPILWRAVQSLGGRPVLYSLAKSTALALDIPLTLHRLHRPSQGRKPSFLMNDDIPPELAFAAVVIVVLKWVYGFDGQRRGPQHPLDPAWALPSYDDYLASLKRLSQMASGSRRVPRLTSSTVSFQHLSDNDLDEYLAFCERALLLGPETGGDVMADYFRVRDEPSNGPKPAMRLPETLLDVPAASVVAKAASDGAGASMGCAQTVRVYSTRDVLGTVSPECELLVGTAARWVGVDVEDVNGVVERYERRLVRWWDRVRREDGEGEGAPA